MTGLRERELQARASRKCRHALSVPHSVSQSACMIIIIIFNKKDPPLAGTDSNQRHPESSALLTKLPPLGSRHKKCFGMFFETFSFKD
jgi:hypothetical protein